jgi:hypothetical protein
LHPPWLLLLGLPPLPLLWSMAGLALFLLVLASVGVLVLAPLPVLLRPKGQRLLRVMTRVGALVLATMLALALPSVLASLPLLWSLPTSASASLALAPLLLRRFGLMGLRLLWLLYLLTAKVNGTGRGGEGGGPGQSALSRCHVEFAYGSPSDSARVADRSQPSWCCFQCARWTRTPRAWRQVFAALASAASHSALV